MAYIFSFCSKKNYSNHLFWTDQKTELENRLEAAREWSFNGFIENLKECMEPEMFEKIKHRIGGKNEIDNRLITMNRYFLGINTKC